MQGTSEGIADFATGCGYLHFSYQNYNGPSLNVLSMTSQWWIIANDTSRLGLNVTMTTNGGGSALMNLFASRRPMFCGRFEIGNNNTQPQNLSISLVCEQRSLSLDNRYNIYINEVERQVIFPSCSLPMFHQSRLCRVKAEKKILFEVYAETGKQSVQVTLSDAAYKSSVYDVITTRRRSYFIAIKKWRSSLSFTQPIISYQVICYPENTVEFEKLERGQTYTVVVWRRGEIVRYVKSIQLI
uniref:uncharacterized protein LOC100185552 isoform X2 n=1 Tax=Ciona intestinalis TaxID=7719 RepID=UPI00089DC68C|nr:uncharacterized protein LOC100185552 isoform X2 [Ciona intestinalis]|eukprot:XP_018672610.1 uncharacterized protein LOC100185552 isoform X2 [Ciona intestinalis]